MTTTTKLSLFIPFFLLLTPFVYSAPLDDLLSSYSFDYSANVLNITQVNDFLTDSDNDGVNDTLAISIETDADVEGNYTFYADIADNSIITGSLTAYISKNNPT